MTIIPVIRKLFLIFLFLSFPSLCFSNIHPEGLTNSKNSVNYTITINEPDQALVEFTFTVTDSILYMSDMGARQLDKGWATFVINLMAESEGGDEIEVTPLSGSRWLIKAPTGRVAKLKYRVLLDHENYAWSSGIDGVAYKRDYGVFYTGRSLFIMNGVDPEEISVVVKMPEAWKVSTVWDRSNAHPNSFKVKTYSELTESMIFAGEHEKLIFKRDGFELVFALGGKNIVAKKEEYKTLASGVLNYYIELMGGVPRPNPSNPLHRVLVIVNSASETDGEVIGNSISILESDQNDPMSQIMLRFLFAHELFHLWNGKSFLPSDERCEWFKEGVSNYYTLKSLYSIGMLDEESFFNILNSFFYHRYINDPGVGSLSLSRGEEKHDHWGLIYSGGMFIGIAQDMIIRSSSNNDKSLDNLMKSLYSEYGGTDKSYTLEDLEKRLSALSGEEQSEFFGNYIKGTDKIPLEDYLQMSGLNSVVKDSQLTISRKETETILEMEMIKGLLGLN